MSNLSPALGGKKALGPTPPSYPCLNGCGATFARVVERGEHSLGCYHLGEPPRERKKRPKPAWKKFEDLVKASAKTQRAAGLDLKKTAPNVNAFGYVQGGGQLDFEGDLRGRAVKFDAKSCAGTSFPVANIQEHQRERVRKAHERGAIAFFLVEMRDTPGGPRYFALSWPAMQPYLAPDAPRKSVTLAGFEARCVEVRRVGAELDLVEAIQAVAGRTP